MNMDQTTLTHIAIGAVAAFLLLRQFGWQKPGSKNPPPSPPAPAAGWFPPYSAPPPPPSHAVAFDIPNLPVKAVITLQPEGDKK
jgi:hypothetical protein